MANIWPTQKANAAIIYGDKVIESSLDIEHVDLPQLSHLGARIGILNSIAEMWTFASTDFRIITLSSGFGKMGTTPPFSTCACLRSADSCTCRSYMDYLQAEFNDPHFPSLQCQREPWSWARILAP